MVKSLAEQLKNIKWEFGNPAHIRALEMLERIGKKRKLLAEKKRTSLLEEIARDEANILFTIKSVDNR